MLTKHNLKIKELAEQIASERIYKDEEINDRINKSNLIKTKSDRITFLKEYARKYHYPGNYIPNELLKCASPTKEFSDFIVCLATKYPNLLENKVLIQFYNHDKETFDFLCKELAKSKDDTILTVLGFIVGEMDQSNPKQVFEWILQHKLTGSSIIGFFLFVILFYHLLVGCMWWIGSCRHLSGRKAQRHSSSDCPIQQQGRKAQLQLGVGPSQLILRRGGYHVFNRFVRKIASAG